MASKAAARGNFVLLGLILLLSACVHLAGAQASGSCKTGGRLQPAGRRPALLRVHALGGLLRRLPHGLLGNLRDGDRAAVAALRRNGASFLGRHLRWVLRGRVRPCAAPCHLPLPLPLAFALSFALAQLP